MLTDTHYTIKRHMVT